LGALLQGLGAAGGGAQFGSIPQARGGGISFTVGPNGNIVAAGGIGGGGGGAAGNARGGGNLPQDPLGATIFRALGLAPPLGGNQGRGARGMQEDPADPDDEDLPRDGPQQDQDRNQNPMRNLAE